MTRFIILLTMVWMTGLPAAHASDPAMEILRRVDDRDRGRDLTWHINLTLTDRSGNSRTREGRIYRRAAGGGRSEQITVFLSPFNIRNTAFLTVDTAAEEDFMWLYLPALKKTKRVPSADRGAKFVGTDFSNEDVKLGFEFEDYNATLIERKTVDGVDAAVIRLAPKTEELKRALGFDDSIAVVRLDNYVMIYQDFFLRGQLIKRNYASRIEMIDGIWTARELGSHDVVNDHKTVIHISNARYNQGMDEDFFGLRTLRREVYR